MDRSISTRRTAPPSCVQYVCGRSCSPGRDPRLAARRLLDARIHTSSSLYTMDLRAHFGCVNAIEFSNNGGDLIASGGDDRRILLWNVEKALNGVGSPHSMPLLHDSNIFCLAFNASNTKIFSGGNDYNILVHDVEKQVTVDYYRDNDAVYSISTNPIDDNVFASACDDGKVHIYDVRSTDDPLLLVDYETPMQAVVYNPAEPRLLATANSGNGVGLWDVRKPQTCLQHYGRHPKEEFCMSVRFNQLGDRLLVLRRRKLPILYRIDSARGSVQFNHEGYRNSCTMKSCTFAGDRDQYVLSGSDDFNVYMWEIPDLPDTIEVDETEKSPVSVDALMVLRGHRSIVNQIRYNERNSLIISSGVEKIIKVWSPLQLPTMLPAAGNPTSWLPRGGRSPIPLDRLDLMTHDYANGSTDEDPHMLAFFDQLVDHEDDTWSQDELSTDSSDSDSSRPAVWRPNPRRSTNLRGSTVMVLLRAAAEATLSRRADLDAEMAQTSDDTSDNDVYDAELSVSDVGRSSLRRSHRFRRIRRLDSSSSSSSSSDTSSASAANPMLDVEIPITTYSSSSSHRLRRNRTLSSTSTSSSSDSDSEPHGWTVGSDDPALTSLTSTQDATDQQSVRNSSNEVVSSGNAALSSLSVTDEETSDEQHHAAMVSSAVTHALHFRESLVRLKRLRERALNSDDDDNSPAPKRSSGTAAADLTASRPACESGDSMDSGSVGQSDSRLQSKTFHRPKLWNGDRLGVSSNWYEGTECLTSHNEDTDSKDVVTSMLENNGSTDPIHLEVIPKESVAGQDCIQNGDTISLVKIISEIPNGQECAAENFHSSERTKFVGRRYRNGEKEIDDRSLQNGVGGDESDSDD